jgi:hypothetical protein
MPPCSAASRCSAPLRPCGRLRRPGPSLRPAVVRQLSSAVDSEQVVLPHQTAKPSIGLSFAGDSSGQKPDAPQQVHLGPTEKDIKFNVDRSPRAQSGTLSEVRAKNQPTGLAPLPPCFLRRCRLAVRGRPPRHWTLRPLAAPSRAPAHEMLSSNRCAVAVTTRLSTGYDPPRLTSPSSLAITPARLGDAAAPPGLPHADGPRIRTSHRDRLSRLPTLERCCAAAVEVTRHPWEGAAR